MSCQGCGVNVRIKTKENDKNVIEFIEAVNHRKRKEDAYRILDIFTHVTGKKAKMWGASIIGFGSYHYKYESDHEGDAPVVGFSPRKARHSLYFAPDESTREELLEKLGKHKAGKVCVYVNKIEDIHIEVLEELIKNTEEHLNKLYGIN